MAMVPVCLALKKDHVLLAVLGGAITYIAVWLALGGLRHTRLWRISLRPPARSTHDFLIEQRVGPLSRDATWRSPMKFCMVTTFFGAHSFGGDAAYVDRLSQALCRRGHEVHVYYCVDAWRAVRGNHPPREYTPPPGLHLHPMRERVRHSLTAGDPGDRPPFLQVGTRCARLSTPPTRTSCTFTTSRWSVGRVCSASVPTAVPSGS